MAIDNKYAGVVLPRIFENGGLSDEITLIGGVDDQRVPINRSLLMASSKHFASALKNGKTKFILDETDGTTLKAIVKFCYTGLIDLTEENVFKFLSISESVELDLLNRKCWLFVNDKMTSTNAGASLITADENSYQKLHHEAFKVISKSFEKLSASEINALDGRWLTEILKNRKIRASQILVFLRLVEWFRQDEYGRGQHMVELLKLIRLDYLPSHFLMGEQLKAIYKRFDCFESLLAERKTRETEREIASKDVRFRSGSIFVLYKSQRDRMIYAERYNSALKMFEDAGKLYVGERCEYEVQLHENNVFVLGGFINGVSQKSVSMIDLTTDIEEVLPEMRVARSTFTSILLGKYIYVFGGVNSVKSNVPAEYEWKDLNSCERFDMKTMTWTVLKPMNIARHGAQAIALDGCIYVVGGQNKSAPHLVKILEKYDPKADEWHQLAILNQRSMQLTLFTSNSWLYTIASGSAYSERYDASEERWIWVKSPPLTSYVASSVQSKGEIFVILKNGQFGKIRLDTNDNWSFELLSRSKYRSELLCRQFLFQN